MAISRSYKYTTFMVLFSIFILLAIYTAVYGYKTYKTKITYSEENTAKILECGAYTYDITGLKYENDLLVFSVTNKYGDTLKSMIVNVDNQTTELELDVRAGETREFSTPLPKLGQLVQFYPKGCEEQNVKNFKIS